MWRDLSMALGNRTKCIDMVSKEMIFERPCSIELH